MPKQVRRIPTWKQARTIYEVFESCIAKGHLTSVNGQAIYAPGWSDAKIAEVAQQELKERGDPMEHGVSPATIATMRNEEVGPSRQKSLKQIVSDQDARIATLEHQLVKVLDHLQL